MFTIYLARPERISSRPLFYSSTSICTLKINHLHYGLYWTRSHSFIGFRGCGTAVLLPNKRSGREVQPLAALYPTVRLSPWRQVRKNIHSRVWTPGPTWSVLHPGGPPLLVPLSSCTGGYGPHPRRLIRTPVQGGYPRYHSILSPPRRASLLVPLSLDLSASLPPEFCPLPFVCSVWYLA